MALTAVQPAMTVEENKTLHPFFSQPNQNVSSEASSVQSNPKDGTASDEPQEAQQIAPASKKRVRNTSSAKAKATGVNDRGQAPIQNYTLQSVVKESGSGALSADEHLANGHNPPEEKPDVTYSRLEGIQTPANSITQSVAANVAVSAKACATKDSTIGKSVVSDDADEAPRKRRRTASPVARRPNPAAQTAEDHRHGCQPPPLGAETELPEIRDKVTMTAGDPSATGSTGEQQSVLSKSDPKQTTPKKSILRIAKNGKLLSSPTHSQPEAAPSPKKKRGRKPKPKPALVVVMRYGADIDSRQIISAKIEGILRGEQRFVHPATQLKKAQVKASAPRKPAGPPKATHPFFLGKPAPKGDEQTSKTAIDSTEAPKTPRKTAVTPGKLRAESRLYHSPQALPSFGRGFGDARIAKHPGMVEAAWPSRGASHVRNLDANEDVLEPVVGKLPVFLRPRKLKQSAIIVREDEDLIACLSRQLESPMQQAKTERMAPKALRLPKRLLTTGPGIQARVQEQISVPVADPGSRKDVHPAISTVFRDVEHTLTPFDNGKCEAQAWTQKYAPQSAAQVLQSGKEPGILTEWLQALTVKAVQGFEEKPKLSSALEGKKPPKRRRKRLEDDFIVDDFETEEDNELVEVDEVDGHRQGAPLTRSLRLPRMTRTKNVVVISGPHGCGKSAMVYAVAKELNFEIFEINSGSRRSGKDIQDRVGDMTENHLVNNKQPEVKTNSGLASAEDTDNERMSKAFQDDIDNGRQATMASFFKSNLAGNAKLKPKPKAPPKESIKVSPKKQASQATLFASQTQQKQQKQSLILFEEADVLFEEDQQFWAQVTKLASQAKRPIVITCTNENAIPSYDLPLAAILRLQPPAVDLAADYMLALAAKEGHVLQRQATRDLFRSKNHDLRASITELDFWCQMSVGDNKGGLDWIYQRWPPGKDVDEHGRTLRVASENTYLSGMGMLSQDTFASSDHVGYNRQEELTSEAWAGWGLPPDSWTEDGTQNCSPRSSDSRCILESLKSLEHLTDCISAADIYSRTGLPSYRSFKHEPMDPSLPPMREKDRLNYTINAPVIQVDTASDFLGFDTSMVIHSHHTIQQLARKTSSTIPTTLHLETPDSATATILNHKQTSQTSQPLTRPIFSEAFDPLAMAPTTSTTLLSATLTPSAFDRPFPIVVEDLAPYVRSIVAHELRLEAQRIQLSSLLSEGGRAKRARTTRASRTALEGGTRETKRRERWFDVEWLDRGLVMGTAGRSWSGLGSLGAGDGEGSVRTESECGMQVEDGEDE